MAVTVEPVRGEEDYFMLKELFREYAASLGIDLSFQSFEAELAGLPGRYAQPEGELFLARNASGEALGCIGVRPLAAPGSCEMKRLYVRAEARGTGAGRALALRALAFAASKGYREMLLDTLPSMEAARELYRSLGFEATEPYCANPNAGTAFLRKVLEGSDVAVSSILRELAAREPIFHRPELGTTRADFDRMMAEDFSEIGASGRVFSRAFVLDLLEERHRTPRVESLQATGFTVRELAEGLYLLHYDLMQGERKTRRTTIWRREGEEWRIVFHQGTIVLHG